MTQTAGPRIPVYLTDFVERRTRGLKLGKAPERFIHLGHWDDPTTASPAGADIERAQDRLNEILVGLAGIQDGMSVLDVGCGVGGTLASIAADHRNLQLTGVNLDARQLEIARSEIFAGTTNTLNWVQGDACALPFEAGSFDRVLAVECEFHFASRRRFFSEVARVLRPGGLLVLSDFLPGEELRAVRASPTFPAFALEVMLDEGLGPWPDPWGDEGSLELLGEQAGLKVISTQDATAQTLPSFASFLAHEGTDAKRIDLRAASPVDRSVATLAWLQERGLLRMMYVVLRRV